MTSVFGACGPTVAPPGSFNNEIGHPYTALRCTPETKFLVTELSARGVGHVRHLTELVPPSIGVVLNVGTAHLGEFGSKEVIAQAKGELVEALPADGVAVLNADDPLVAAMRSRTQARVLEFSAQHPADVWADALCFDELQRARFDLVVGDSSKLALFPMTPRCAKCVKSLKAWACAPTPKWCKVAVAGQRVCA